MLYSGSRAKIILAAKAGAMMIYAAQLEALQAGAFQHMCRHSGMGKDRVLMGLFVVPSHMAK